MSDGDGTGESRKAAESRSPGSPYTQDPSPHDRPPHAAPPASRVGGEDDRREGIAGEGNRWRQVMPVLEDRLRDFGYDISSARVDEASGTVVARRDLGDRAVVIAIDAAGRFGATITWVVGEWPSRDEIAGVPVRVVDSVSRAVTVTGQMDRPEQVAEVVAGLGTIVPWASAAGDEPPPA